MTMAFLGLVMQEIVYAVICRNPHVSVFKQGIFSNKIMNYGLLGVIAVNMVVFLTPVGNLFRVASLSLSQFGILLLIALIAFVVIELCKPVLGKLFKDE